MQPDLVSIKAVTGGEGMDKALKAVNAELAAAVKQAKALEDECILLQQQLSDKEVTTRTVTPKDVAPKREKKPRKRS